MINYLFYDIKNSIRNNKYKFLLFGLTIIVFYAFFIVECGVLTQSNKLSSSPTIADGAIYMLRGMYEYHPELGDPFEIPVSWLIIQVFISFTVDKYMNDGFEGIGQQLLLRSKKKRNWFLGKLLYCLSTIIIFYLIIGLILGVGALLGYTSFSFLPSSDVCLYMSDINEESTMLLNAQNVLIYVIVLPMVTSFVISVGQVLLSIIFKPLISFVIVIIYQVCSAYFSLSFFIGTYSMVLRSRYCSYGGYTIGTALRAEIILFSCLILASVFKLKKQDFLVRK